MLHPDHFDMTKVQPNIMKKVCKFEFRLQAFGFPPMYRLVMGVCEGRRLC